jgi:hypothetical protein
MSSEVRFRVVDCAGFREYVLTNRFGVFDCDEAASRLGDIERGFE